MAAERGISLPAPISEALAEKLRAKMEGLDELLAPRLRLLRQAQSLNERVKLRILAATIEYRFYGQLVQSLFVIG